MYYDTDAFSSTSYYNICHICCILSCHSLQVCPSSLMFHWDLPRQSSVHTGIPSYQSAPKCHTLNTRGICRELLSAVSVYYTYILYTIQLYIKCRIKGHLSSYNNLRGGLNFVLLHQHQLCILHLVAVCGRHSLLIPGTRREMGDGFVVPNQVARTLAVSIVMQEAHYRKA